MQEAMCHHSAAQERAQLLLDEAGSGLVPTLRACEEGLEVLTDDLVEQGARGLVALVLDGPIAGPGAPLQSKQVWCLLTVGPRAAVRGTLPPARAGPRRWRRRRGLRDLGKSHRGTFRLSPL